MNRLAHLPTLRVDSARERRLTYGRRSLHGLAGDTVATALFANGVRIFSRSLKYHRPRGLYSLDGECANACMTVDGVPNVFAETLPLRDGMRVAPQNVVGSPRWDLMGFMDRLDAFMPAGFYYRTLHKPAAIWPLAMKLVRRAAGLGVLSPDFVLPGTFDAVYPAADVCVIGGGPAGMAAALAAAEAGCRTILVEARPHLGGCFDYRAATGRSGPPLYERSRRLARAVSRSPRIRVMTRTALAGVYGGRRVTAIQTGAAADPFDQRYVEISPQSLVVATGCIERPLIFEHNEKPGVMQVGCAHRLARTYGLRPGREAVFSIGHDSGLEAAADLADLGVTVRCVADIRQDGQNADLLQALTRRGIPVWPGWVAVRAHGGKTVSGATLATVEGTVRRRLPCDLLVASAGLTPANGPLTLAGARLAHDARTGYFLPVKMPEKIFSAGRMTGRNHAQAVVASGELAGWRAAAACGREHPEALAAAERRMASLPGPERGTKLVTAPVRGRKSFVCFDEDTTVKNIQQALARGFDVPELIKRFTAAGTGPGQGGVPGHNLPLLVARLRPEAPVAKPTTVRPPLAPALLAAYAGNGREMGKRTPVHRAQAAAGGVFRRIGAWQRARYFSADETCRKEIETVRTRVGILDASTLGKFRIHGPDAVKALQRVYVSNMNRAVAGRVKYSAMCNDDGCVVDDGVVVRNGENDFYFTTSTGRAGSTVEWIRYHTRFDGWQFHLVDLTDAMGVVNLAGPSARKVLARVTDADVSDEAFPFAAVRNLSVKGTIPVRAMRLGFVGELSYELHAPSSWMPALWDSLLAAGAPLGIRPFGVEAQNVLRMEKGHVILGSESEQRTNLLDLGLGFLWDRSKTEARTVGAVALAQAENDPDRLKLVGFRMADGDRAPRDGSVIVDDHVRGYVCTARSSAALGRAVGMALVEAPLAAAGTRLSIYEDECGGRLLHAQVANMPFYDPDGRRMRG